MTADDIIAALDLAPHPEGGCFKETYRHKDADGGRAAGTAIYYLLRAGEVSAWHRVTDADEVWHWYGGAALELRIAEEDGPVETKVLGPAIVDGERPQILVPVNAWQSAHSLGAWTLVGCTVTPGFDFASFEMAPDGWEPA